MSNVQYDDGTQEFGAPLSSRSAASGLADILVKRGIAKDTKQAEIMLIGVVVVAMMVGFFAYRSMGTSSLPSDTSRLLAPPPGPKN